MNFDLTPEQRDLKQAVRRFLEKEVAPLAEQYKEEVLPKELLTEVLKKMVPMGYIVGAIPEEDGGAGLDHISQGILAEELWRVYSGLGGIVFITSECTRAIAMEGTAAQKARYLPRLMSGEWIGSMGITEPDVGSDASAVKTTARDDGDSYVINGTKLWISNGGVSDVCIVVARTNPEAGRKGLSRIIVEREAHGYTTRDIKKLGWNSFPTSEMVLEDTRVPKSNVLGVPGDALRATLKEFERARCFVGIGGLAVSQAAFDTAVAYANQRVQWGKLLAEHQLIQEMIADMYAELEASRLLVYRGLYMLDEGVRCDTETSLAKAYATEAAVRITSMAIQIHGAYGLSREFPVEGYFRDARMLTIPDGTTQIQKLIMARNILGHAAFA